MNGGHFEEDQIITEYTEKKTIGLTIPIKEGYVFDGWYLDNNFNGDSIYTTQGKKGELVIYAKWVSETYDSYFNYENNIITGFSEEGKKAYEAGELDTLIIPRKNKEVEINTIKQSAFNGYSKIEKLILQSNIETMEGNSFTNCSGIKELVIPISLNADSSSFSGCNKLEKIKFTKGTGQGFDYYYYSSGKSYNRTPWYFSRNNTITVELEEGITSLGTYMFSGCTGLKMVNFPTTLTNIGNNAFENCTSMIGTLSIPDTVTELGSNAFSGCSGITGTLEVPGQISSIKQSTFSGCSGIEKLILKSNIETMEINSFTNCSGIKELVIPISLNADSSSFSGCNKLEKIKFIKGTGQGFDYYYYSSGKSYNKTPWYFSKDNKLQIILSNGIQYIGTNTFNGLENATFYYTGTDIEWSNVNIGDNNTSLDATEIILNFSE